MRIAINVARNEAQKLNREAMEDSDIDSTVQSSITNSQTRSQVHHKVRKLPPWLTAIEHTRDKMASKPSFDIPRVKHEPDQYNGTSTMSDSLPTKHEPEVLIEVNEYESYTDSQVQRKVRTLPSWLTAKNVERNKIANTSTSSNSSPIKHEPDVLIEVNEYESYTDSQVHRKVRTLPSWLTAKNIERTRDNVTDTNTISDSLLIKHEPEVLIEVNEYESYTNSQVHPKVDTLPSRLPAKKTETRDNVLSIPTLDVTNVKYEPDFYNDNITTPDSSLVKQEPEVLTEINEDQHDTDSPNNSLPQGDHISGFVSSVKAESVESDSASNRAPQQSHNSSLDPDSHITPAVTTPKRPACQYGDRCYRRNVQHKNDFSHPGDIDFEQTDYDSDTSAKQKPVCWYGSRCFRKNEAHKQQFYHPSRSQTHTRRTRTGRTSRTQESDNSDGYESSFIDDSSLDDIEISESESEHGFSDFEEVSSSEDETERSKAKKMKKNTFSLF